MKPSEGDYCRYNMEIIYNRDGHTICDYCPLRCVYATDKTERNYLLKKDDKNNRK